MSVTINVDTSELEEKIRALDHVDESLRNQVQKRLAEWALNVKLSAERLVPVKTGYLQSTIFVDSHQWEVKVGAQAPYAAAVEFGTGRIQARPYLTPAVDTHLPSLGLVLLQAIESSKVEAQI